MHTHVPSAFTCFGQHKLQSPKVDKNRVMALFGHIALQVVLFSLLRPSHYQSLGQTTRIKTNTIISKKIAACRLRSKTYDNPRFLPKKDSSCSQKGSSEGTKS